MTRSFATVLLVLLVLVVGCDSVRLGAPLGSTAATGGSGVIGGAPAASGIVGSWRRIVYFLADDGSASASETTWRFGSDGSASRLSVTRNFTAGLADAQTVDARWEALAQSMRITFLPPSSGTFEYSYRISRDTLYLASQAYARVGR